MILLAKMTVKAVVEPEEEGFFRAHSPEGQAELMQGQVKVIEETLRGLSPEGSEITVTVEEVPE